MASILVRRDQFNITPQGITHKPTDASYEPYIGDPRTGRIRLGQLGSVGATGEGFDPNQVKRMMEQLWAEYIEANWGLIVKAHESPKAQGSELTHGDNQPASPGRRH
jgi:hypothetical protein